MQEAVKGLTRESPQAGAPLVAARGTPIPAPDRQNWSSHGPCDPEDDQLYLRSSERPAVTAMKLRLRYQLALFTIIRAVFNTMHRMIYPFLGVFARGLGVNIAELSLALTARSVIGTFGPFAATVADQRGRKFGMLLGLGVFTAGVAVVVFWPTLAGLTIALVMSTMGKYIFDPGMQAYIGDRVPYERRGLAIAITEFGWSLAFILGIPLMGFMISRNGWMAPFPLLTLLGALMFGLLYFILPRDDHRPHPDATVFSNMRLVLASGPALAGLSIGLWASAGNEVVNLIFGVWLEDAFALKIAALAGASAVIGFSELGGEGLVALFVDRLGKHRAVSIGLIANSLAALLLPIVGRTPSGALLGLFLFYISFEFTLVSIIPMMTEVLPEARATVMAFNVAALSLGRAIGAPLAPFLYHHGFPVVAAGAVVFNVFALLALRRMGKRQ
jgi:predicted MFS family arabinose efflux permease